MSDIYITHRNLSITDTIGTSELVLLIEMSFIEGFFNIINYQNGTRIVSLVARCPLFRGVLYKGFHCNPFNRSLVILGDLINCVLCVSS